MEFELSDFKLGDRSDHIRKLLIASEAKTITTEKIGEDDFGLIVEWTVANVVMTFSKRSKIAPYTLVQIRETDNAR